MREKQEGGGQGSKWATEHPCAVRTVHCLDCEGRYMKTQVRDKVV